MSTRSMTLFLIRTLIVLALVVGLAFYVGWSWMTGLAVGLVALAAVAQGGVLFWQRGKDVSK
ncbi:MULTISPECIES: hypothetical protein [unclassified Saccharopolyspora]|uniref:hypothetical protein n=1 Tax=unclassified Saccharopolyspora TaxID=2646250 RepID=UPI001CD43F53|nr:MULTISPECIES: hypothetical protein [unclassified Saccharopolyspora]MCA1194965.1 hypothetical protein [Saccharopolyspora sp. 6V]MCA1227612.1 hypothetical protein [Saccharopolyspora sp. 6M]